MSTVTESLVSRAIDQALSELADSDSESALFDSFESVRWEIVKDNSIDLTVEDGQVTKRVVIIVKELLSGR